MFRELVLSALALMALVSGLWLWVRYLEWRDGEAAVKADIQKRLDEAVARHNRYYERWLAPRKRKGPPPR
jgi:hypothetical protein